MDFFFLVVWTDGHLENYNMYKTKKISAIFEYGYFPSNNQWSLDPNKVILKFLKLLQYLKFQTV